MKNNYTKKIKTAFGILAIGMLQMAQAQTTAVPGEVTITPTVAEETEGVTAYADYGVNNTTTFTSAEITHDGAKFKLRITATPTVTGTGIVAASTGVWGIKGIVTTTSIQEANVANHATFDGTSTEQATISNITVVDFNAGTTAYTAASISDLALNSVTIPGGNNKRDRCNITLGATTIAIGRMAESPEEITFDETFANFAETTIDFTAETDRSSLTIDNYTNTASSNRWNISGVNVKYVFTEDTTLSSKDIAGNSNKAFVVTPNPATASFSVSTAYSSLELIDITGKTVKTFSSSDALTVSGLASGVYILKVVTTEGSVLVDRLFVQ